MRAYGIFKFSIQIGRLIYQSQLTNFHILTSATIIDARRCKRMLKDFKICKKMLRNATSP